MPNVGAIIEALAVRLVGVVAEDEKFIECSITGVPMVMNKKIKQRKVFLNIARRICGENIPIKEVKKRLFS
jgi:septum site-determining protein MinD